MPHWKRFYSTNLEFPWLCHFSACPIPCCSLAHAAHPWEYQNQVALSHPVPLLPQIRIFWGVLLVPTLQVIKFITETQCGQLSIFLLSGECLEFVLVRIHAPLSLETFSFWSIKVKLSSSVPIDCLPPSKSGLWRPPGVKCFVLIFVKVNFLFRWCFP